MDFFVFLVFISKLLMLLLKVTKVTTGHQKMPKMGQNSIINSFFARRAKKPFAKGQSPPQELEVGPRDVSSSIINMKEELLFVNILCYQLTRQWPNNTGFLEVFHSFPFHF